MMALMLDPSYKASLVFVNLLIEKKPWKLYTNATSSVATYACQNEQLCESNSYYKYSIC
jgi:hypothetical protein